MHMMDIDWIVNIKKWVQKKKTKKGQQAEEKEEKENKTITKRKNKKKTYRADG